MNSNVDSQAVVTKIIIHIPNYFHIPLFTNIINIFGHFFAMNLVENILKAL